MTTTYSVTDNVRKYAQSGWNTSFASNKLCKRQTVTASVSDVESILS